MTMTLVSTVTVGAGGVASISFTGIPQTATDALLIVSARSANAVIQDSLFITFNGSSSGYANRFLEGNGSVTGSGTYGASGLILNNGVNGNSTTANTFSNSAIYIPNYTASVAKSVSFDGVTENNASTAGINIQAGSWSGTAAITSMSIICGGGGNLSQYTTASLYLITKGSGGATVS